MFKKSKVIRIIQEHVRNNIKEYIVILLLFVIGVFIGVFFVNNLSEIQKSEITIYINQFIDNLKNINQLDNMALLKNSIIQNLIIALLIWFFGTTVIGMPIVFGLIIYRGFCLGYVVSTSVLVLGMPQGLIFAIISLLLQNILIIPAILGLGVSGIKLYKSIVKNKTRENIKIEILRHTIFSGIMFIILILSSVIEICISTNLLKLIVNYF